MTNALTSASKKVKTAAKKKPLRFPRAVKNITDIYALATPEEIAGGLTWYQDANDFAHQQAQLYGLPVATVAGVISALSPGTDWERNKRDAEEVLKGNREHKCGTYGPNVEKAFKICEAARNDVAEFFPADKTFNFYHNIINPGAKEYVTIDRHALSVALGATREDKSITKVEYRELAQHYNRAAKKLGVLPQQVQAVTWVTWRNRKGLKSKFTLADILAQPTAVSFGKSA